MNQKLETTFYQNPLASVALWLVAAAPLLFGCQPPWASGFLLALVMLLAIALIGMSAWRGQAWAFDSSILNAALGLLFSWLLATVLHDLWAGAGNGRVPDASLRKLPYAAAFVSAALLGRAYCSSPERLRRVLCLFSVCGVILALFALAQTWLHWDVKSLAGWRGDDTRPGGLYTNANRFAVMLSCCWICDAAILADLVWKSRRQGVRFAGGMALPILALLLMGCSIGLTLSRLTLLTVAAVLGLFALIGALAARASVRQSELEGRSPREALQNAMLLAIPMVIVAGWAAWCLIIGNANLRTRFAQLHGDMSLDSRVRVATLSFPLILQQPFWGHGLGSFESIFTTVQPVDVPGRWRELHSDWLQLAFEGGLPTLALVFFVMAAWTRALWTTVKSELAAGAPAPLLRIVPAAAILVVAVCSLADFPLREPATATLVFFLAGAICDPFPVSADCARAASRMNRIAALLCMAALAVSAAVAARNSLAYAASPWFGRFYSPESTAEQLGAWQRAAGIDPGDPELRFRLASAALVSAGAEVPRTKPASAQLQMAFDEAAKAAEMQPFDFRFPWQQAAAAELLGRAEEARVLRERAVARAPANAWLREQAGRMYLREVVRGTAGDEARDGALDSALEHFRVVLQAAPQREAALIGALENAQCLNSEIAALWPADTEVNRIRRARFYCTQGQWDMAERDLRGAEPAGNLERAWYHAVLGTIALRRGDIPAGTQGWLNALSAGEGTAGETPAVRGMAGELDAWLTEQAQEFQFDACEKLAGALNERLLRYPRTAFTLAQKLVQQRRWVQADRLLAAVAQGSADLGALWAELALEMGDFRVAGIRARAAWEQELSSPRRGTWYDEFCNRLKQRQERGRL